MEQYEPGDVAYRPSAQAPAAAPTSSVVYQPTNPGWGQNPAYPGYQPPVQGSSTWPTGGAPPPTYSPPASAAPPATLPSVAPPTAPTAYGDFSNMLSNVQATPEYKQAMENVANWNTQQQNQINFDSEWAAKFFNQNLSQIGSGEQLAAQNDALQKLSGQQQLSTAQQQIEAAKAKAARDYGQQQKYLKESLTGRGNAGGQLGFENNNLNFGYDQFLAAQGLNANNAQQAYDMLTKQIDLGAQGRQLDIANQTSNLNLTHDQQIAQTTLARQQLASAVAQKNGEALMQVEQQLIQMWWDPTTGTYRGPGAQTISSQQASTTLPGPTQPTSGNTDQTYGTGAQLDRMNSIYNQNYNRNMGF